MIIISKLNIKSLVFLSSIILSATVLSLREEIMRNGLAQAVHFKAVGYFIYILYYGSLSYFIYVIYQYYRYRNKFLRLDDAAVYVANKKICHIDELESVQYEVNNFGFGEIEFSKKNGEIYKIKKYLLEEKSIDVVNKFAQIYDFD